MKCRFLLQLLLVLVHQQAISQVFSGSFESVYQCNLKLNEDSSVQLVYSYKNNCIYAEYDGHIARVSDSIYRLELELVFGQFFKRSANPDTLKIHIDTPHVQLDRILVSFTNGSYREVTCKDRKGILRPVLAVPVRNNLPPDIGAYDDMTLTINRRDPIYGQLLEFRIPYGSYASFTAKRPLRFDVMLQGEYLRFLEEPFPQTSRMVMRCMKKKL